MRVPLLLSEDTMNRHAHVASTITLIALAAAALAGCGNDFTPESYIEHPRVLGAAVDVGDAADPGRAWVRPGEQATVTWLTVARQDPTPLAWAFVLCPGSDRACAGAPLATLTGQGPTTAVTFTMPELASLGSAPSVALVGAISANGTSTTDVAFTVPLQTGDATNHNPVLADDLLQLDGADWPAGALPPVDAGCDASTGLPMVTATPDGQTATRHHVRLVSDGNDRESYLVGTTETLEDLQISQFTTAGKLLHTYSLIPASDTRPDADVTIDWEPPSTNDVPAGGLVVQMHFVMRDLRGGIDWIHRALCVRR